MCSTGSGTVSKGTIYEINFVSMRWGQVVERPVQGELVSADSGSCEIDEIDSISSEFALFLVNMYA